MPKVMISLPADLLEAVDEEAARRGSTRSGLIARAARRELDRRDPDVMRAAAGRSEARFSASGAFESADLVREERDARR